jgi:hypothetical protein
MSNNSVLFDREIVELWHIGACTICHNFDELVEVYIRTIRGSSDVQVVCCNCVDKVEP